MGIVDDLLSRLGRMEEARRRYESTWQDIADYTDPMSSLTFEMNRSGDFTMQRSDYGTSGQRGARRRYDTTAVTASLRLAAGIESLVTPQSEKWHGLASKDPLAAEPTDVEERFFDKTRDYLFNIRYDARSGFHNANQAVLGSAVRYGTGIMLTEEAFGMDGRSVREMPMRYRYIPLSECYIALNNYGEPDTIFRKFQLSARNMVKMFGSKCHPKISEMAGKSNMMDQMFVVLHAVCPREEKGSKESGSDKRKFASYYVDCHHRHMMKDNGFFELPYAVSYWHSDGLSGYGESPLTAILDDVRGLNFTVFNARRAMAKKIDPAYFMGNDGQMNRPNLNPGKINYAQFDANGRVQFQPIQTDVALSELANIVDVDRNVIREGMHQNLFNILAQNPGMTATEALLRSNEKADLLGPNGARLQRGLSDMVDIELAILARHGAFDVGASLEAPESLYDQDIGVRFTSPIDRLRKAQEALGVNNLLQAFGMMAQMGKPEALDRLDVDEIGDIIREAQGVPRKALLPDDIVAEKRASNAQAAQFQQATQLVEGAGKAGNELLPAIAGMSQLAQAPAQ